MIKLDDEQAARFYEFIDRFEQLLCDYGLELDFKDGKIRDTIKKKTISCYMNLCKDFAGAPFSTLVLTEDK